MQSDIIKGIYWNLLQWWELVTALEKPLEYADHLSLEMNSYVHTHTITQSLLWFLTEITELFKLEKTSKLIETNH